MCQFQVIKNTAQFLKMIWIGVFVVLCRSESALSQTIVEKNKDVVALKLNCDTKTLQKEGQSKVEACRQKLGLVGRELTMVEKELADKFGECLMASVTESCTQ